MQNWRSVTDVITAERMIQNLAGVCNGASTWDGAGFSRMDVSLGHSLAERAQQGRSWTQKQAAAALKLIQKYAGQLGGKDQVRAWMQAPNFAIMPQDPVSVPKRVERKLTSSDQLAVFQCSYDEKLIAAIKQIKGEHKGVPYRATWAPDRKVWQVPVNRVSIMHIMQLARDWEFEIEERFESYYSRVCEHMAPIVEAAQDSKVSMALGSESGVWVQGDQIQIIHADPIVLAEFQAALVGGA
jgi:hypothetical protein